MIFFFRNAKIQAKIVIFECASIPYQRLSKLQKSFVFLENHGQIHPSRQFNKIPLKLNIYMSFYCLIFAYLLSIYPLSTCLSIFLLSICQSILSIYLSIFLLSIYLSICLPIYLFVSLFVYLFVYLLVYCLLVYLFVYCLFFYVFVCCVFSFLSVLKQKIETRKKKAPLFVYLFVYRFVLLKIETPQNKAPLF